MVALCCAPSAFVFSAKGTDASMLMSALDIGFPWPNAGSDMRVLPQIAATIICFSSIVRFRLLRTRNSEQSSGRAEGVLSTLLPLSIRLGFSGFIPHQTKADVGRSL